MKSIEGWTEWRDMRIDQKVKESEVITSFYLVPVDGKPLPTFLPGQYISVMTDVPVLGHKQARQYSLSESPRKDYYRISVKKEKGLNMADPESTRHPGYISNILHDDRSVGDVLSVSHPFGEFVLEQDKHEGDAPVVLLSAGVGLTCLMSMLNSTVESRRPITWVHGAKTTSARAFTGHIRKLDAEHDNLHAILFVSNPEEKDVPGVDFHQSGRVALERLDSDKDLFLDDARSQYFVCGPTGFIMDMRRGLWERGVEQDRVHAELFGTGGLPQGGDGVL
jgi:nitric oxide dioxygenase